MVAYTQHDLLFILDGIRVSEGHADATNNVASNGTSDVWTVTDLETSRQILLDLLPNSLEPIGMRTITGELNNLVIGQEDFGATGEFPRLLDPSFRDGGPEAPFNGITNTDYGNSGNVVDSDPRLISNLISDQNSTNPVAEWVAENTDGSEANIDGNGLFFIPNVAPDEGLSAPFNSWMTLFGQFFDHGLDLVGKGGNGTVYIPLKADDPLIAGADGIFGNDDDLPEYLQFMAVTRATVDADGIPGTADDQEATNFTSPFVDQNQTYTSHPSHQIFVREYIESSNGPAATGRLIEGLGGSNGSEGGMATWGDVKAQAASILGIQLTDAEALDIPLFAVDQYGEYLRGDNGLPQFVIELDGGSRVLVEGSTAGDGMSVAEAEAQALADNPTATSAAAIKTGFAFLLDIAHSAAPVFDTNGDLVPDADSDAGNDVAFNPSTGANLEYDDELLDAHFIAGDGRANENIGLTAVHHVFHQEHNRLVEHIKQVLVDGLNSGDLATVDDPDGSATSEALLRGYLIIGENEPLPADLADYVWNGDRLFQAAKFGTEMQYQHLVFEEFGRKVQPLIDLFASYETSIDASIVAEFAHTVYRFGHSMLTETVDLMDADGTLTEVGLIQAFLNPLGFHQDIQADGSVVSTADFNSNEIAADIIRGMTRQTGNAIDEFITDALRDNLLGLPLDLAAINIARGRETGIPTLNDARAQFYEGTGDTKLKPYENWVDFAQNLKHGGASIVNFIAAYGQHDTITAQDTIAGKRAAAYALTTGDPSGLDGILGNADDVAVPADRLDFLNGTGNWAGVETGLNLVDFWIGGLAETTEPFGGMLGSTFNFVFEQQMEDLQDGDRFYYLERTGGLNFLSQLEQNSFANMIIRNTDIGDNGADHLPGDIFSTPTWILEIDQSRQITGLEDPIGGPGTLNGDPTGEGESGGSLNPFLDLGSNSLVMRDDLDGDGDNDKLHFTGGDHVVLGGTEEADMLIGGIGDDTLWGDGGDDVLEGGDGGDILLGGTGDDILTDIGGVNNIQGQEGNDAIFAGGGESLILAGAGKDFVLQGPDLAETFGGLGNDFIHAGTESNIVFGNEGSDWLEGGGGNNLLVGDNGDPFLSSTVGGHDVFISGQGDDDYDAEGGDDIMEGADGIQRFEGMNGFDWATYKDVDQGVNADMLLRAFDETPLPPSNVSIMDRFDSVEGLSGGRGGDILRGSDQVAVDIAALNNGNNSVLSGDERFAQIHGLREGDNAGSYDGETIFDASVTSWGDGDIILGGAGSDIIEGRGGNDIIDGDLKLDVRLLVRDADTGVPVATAFEMQGQLYAVNADGSLDRSAPGGALTEITITGPNGDHSFLDDAVFDSGVHATDDTKLDRAVNPFNIEIFREIVREEDGDGFDDFDTAQFSDVQANYTITDLGDGFTEVSHLGGQGTDGVDKIRNIERLVFSDTTVNLASGNEQATGQPEIIDVATGLALTSPFVGQDLRATPGDIADTEIADINTVSITYTWQIEEEPGTGIFVDFVVINASGEEGPLEGAEIQVPPEALGLAMRVRASFRDDNNVIEFALSDATVAVANNIDPSANATNGPDTLIGTLGNDVIDGLAGDDEIFGLAGNDILIGGPGSDILDGGIDGGGLGDIAQFGFSQADALFLTDEDGNLEVVYNGTDTAFIGDENLLLNIETLRFTDGDVNVQSISVGEDIEGTAGADELEGTAFGDRINGNEGDDDISGEGGDDIVNGGAGNDVISWRAGDGRDIIDGGTDDGTTGDTFEMRNQGGVAETIRFYAVSGTNAANLADITNRFGALDSDTEIVVTTDDGVNGEMIVAELDNIEEVIIRNTAIDPGIGGGQADGDTFQLIGDFDETSMFPSTFTIEGTPGDDVVDISAITSAHRVVFRSNGGTDTIIGLRPQDEIDWVPGSVITDHGDGTTTVTSPNFFFTNDDTTELLNLVRGLPSENLRKDYATGIRDLEGTGNNQVPGQEDFGSATQPFIRLTDARYGEYNPTINNYDVNPIFAGLDPREISNILGDQDVHIPNSEGGNLFFMAFGQYFDHGLDFLPKGGNGILPIGTDPNDDPADLTRGHVDNPGELVDENGNPTGALPEHLNMASPYVDQNQAYGSTELVGQFLREGIGGGELGSRLLAGAPDPSNTDMQLLPTLRELILHHWENDTIFSDPGLGVDPISFQDYFTALPYEITLQDGTVIDTETLSDGSVVPLMGTLVENGVINEAMVPFVNADFMGSGYTLVGDANPFINLLDHYVAGDLRANENYTLTSMHTIWARNHNYHVEKLAAAGFDGTEEELFQAAKIVNEAEYQRVVFEEFAEKLFGGISGSGNHGFDEYNPDANAQISHEFAAAVYRVGHSLISQEITIVDANGDAKKVPLTDVFLNPTNDDEAFDLPPQFQGLPYDAAPGYEQLGLNGVIEGIVDQQAEEVDFNIVDAVRDDLVRIRADLFAFNVARGWDVGLGTLNQVRADLAASQDPYVKEAADRVDLTPYTSWADFKDRNNLSQSVINQFMLAYPALILAAGEIQAFKDANPDIEITMGTDTNGNVTGTVKGIDRVDLWVGGLAEEHVRDGMVGSTFFTVLHEQFDRLQEADRFYYLDRVDRFDFYDIVEDQTFADIVARNTGLEGLPADIFAATSALDTDQPDDGDQGNNDDGQNDDGDQQNGGGQQNGGDNGNTDGGTGDGGTQTDDKADPMILEGDDGANTLVGSTGDDTLTGKGGADVLLAGDGDNTVSGGEGADDIVTGGGHDVILGGAGSDYIVSDGDGEAGNDMIMAGDGDDLIFSGGGDDIVIGGADRDVVDAGAGDDTFYARMYDGDDVYNAGSGTDTLDLSAITDDVTVDLGLGAFGNASSVQLGTDTLSGFENVVGGFGNDTITANEVANVVAGGAGEDTFVFNSVEAADGDHITDFFHTGDTIDLSGIASQYGLGGFTLGTSLSAAGDLIVNDAGDHLTVEGSVNGAGADFVIKVSGTSNLTEEDFHGLI